MKSGLEGRNNSPRRILVAIRIRFVSMKSGLEDRNNVPAIVAMVNAIKSQ